MTTIPQEDGQFYNSGQDWWSLIYTHAIVVCVGMIERCIGLIEMYICLIEKCIIIYNCNVSFNVAAYPIGVNWPIHEIAIH